MWDLRTHVFTNSDDQVFLHLSTAETKPAWPPGESEDQIEELSVKQLKIVLKRNCIDFKGCVEKQELTERVRRLWIARQKEKGNCWQLLK